MRGQRLAAPGQGVQEGLRLGALGPEAIAAAQLVRAAFLPGEGGEVRDVLDRLAAVVAADVAGDLTPGCEFSSRAQLRPILASPHA